MASNDCVKLYYFPGSFYSQKALLALYEKNVSFAKQLVFIHFGEHTQKWYMKINPKGLVPVLQHGDKYIAESEDIIDYVDKNFSSGHCLVPKKECKIGQSVTKWRKKISDIPIETISYGILYNRDLTVSGLKIETKNTPFETPESTLAMWTKIIKEMEEKADKNPELRDDFLAKIAKKRETTASAQDRRQVEQTLEALEKILDDVEKQLTDTQTEQGVPDAWLLGPRFTAADIGLAILLDRIFMLGIEERCFPKDKRPLLHDYYQRLGKKESVQALRKEVDSAKIEIMKKMAGKFVPYVSAALGISAVIAIVAYMKK